ncbi:KAP family NTPase [Microbacterium sp. KSW4-17]|uniref:KAP family NTPase n=1 Tax=Microbacterium galbum TaxID=3075994 RepID=A0ABU3T8C1_9MICO|nr:KAP family NTPase [Microbacterium sp. KSW4-17]MDU0367626.1 KAP family NTPase [Microbacterium sp. KSW4-17]
MKKNAWTDEALSSKDEDALGRSPYAERAAALIHATHSFESSAVFGLSGPWGSGKTSLVNMIVEELQGQHPEWAVARFTPWATSDISGLLGEFHSSLAEVLPKKKGKQVRQALAVTASVAAPAANLIPYAGGAAAEGARLISEALAKSPSWQVAFSKASKELAELKKPILVVVDDIDRLHGDELLALLKVVRLLGRFAGVQYLLAYDDETLYRSMTASSAVNPHDGSAERFMEKIVQYPIFVPPLLRHQQVTRLNTGLAQISRETVDDGLSGQRLGALVKCFTDLLTTPRAIDRYVAQLQHHIPLLPPNEIDDEDVQLLTLIRVSFPALFNAIPLYRSELLSGHTGEMKFDAKSITYEPFDIESLLKVVPTDRRGTARKLLVSLFPKNQTKDQLSVHASTRRQSVQHEEYFDRYFAMGILDHDVSDATVDAAVKAATSGDSEPLTRLLIGTADEQRSLVLGKCQSPSNQPAGDPDRAQLAEVLAEIANLLPSDDAVPFSDLDQILAWIAELLVALGKDTPPETVQAVLWKIDNPARRIRAWRRVENSIDHAYRSAKPTWYDTATATLVDDSIAGFLNHLKQGDDAAAGSGVGYQVHFVLRHRAEDLRAAVRELLDGKEVHISVLASRLVSAQTITGIQPDWKLSEDFDQETFNQIAPPGRDPWYDEPIQDVDVRDLSWANRRNFAAGRVSPPPTAL